MKPEDIILIEPPFPYPSLVPTWPSSISLLAANIEATTGYTTRVLEYASRQDFSWETFEDDIMRQAAGRGVKVFGLRTFTENYPEARRAATIIKRHIPDAVIIVGGYHVSPIPGICLQHNPAFDIIVSGEGEITLAELMGVLKRGGELSQVAGITYRANNGRIVSTSPRTPLSGPALGRLRFQQGSPGDDVTYATVMTSRGCPFRCAYCSIASFWDLSSYCARPIDSVMDEIDCLVRGKGLKKIYFRDAIFNIDARRLDDFCRRVIARKQHDPAFQFSWNCNCRVELLDRDQLKRMKDAGVAMILFGLESFDEVPLRAVKGGNFSGDGFSYDRYLRKIEEVFAACHELEIATLATMMLGLPYESADTFEKNMDHLKRIHPTVTTFFFTTLYPGVPLFHTYAQEPGYEWLSGVLREDVYENGYGFDECPPELGVMVGNGVRGIKPRYVKKDVFLSTGSVLHDFERMKRDFLAYEAAFAAAQLGTSTTVNELNRTVFRQQPGGGGRR